MNIQKNLDIARQLGAGASPEAISMMFSSDLAWHLPGDPSVLPWVGHKRGRAAVVEFVRDSSAMIERISLAVHDVLASEARAIIVGALSTRIKVTGKIIETPYAIVLTMADALITEFLMLEYSFAVALAARA